MHDDVQVGMRPAERSRKALFFRDNLARRMSTVVSERQVVLRHVARPIVTSKVLGHVSALDDENPTELDGRTSRSLIIAVNVVVWILVQGIGSGSGLPGLALRVTDDPRRADGSGRGRRASTKSRSARSHRCHDRRARLDGPDFDVHARRAGCT